MPTYEYVCTSCGADFDVFQSMSDAPLKVCPTCGNSVRRKINGGTGIIFKGSGFYKNDNRKSSAPRGASASRGDSSGGDAHQETGSKGAAESQAKTGGETSSTSSSAADTPKKDAT
jgi:putative FmdB family regulatory protein